MTSAGLSKARLSRLRNVMAGYVARGEVPGLVALVSRRGEEYVEALGVKALGGSNPVQRDTIFRIASMTKPITAAAAMILVEECKLRLDDPVDRLLPELADRRVLKRLEGPLDDTEPAQRPITLRDLLSFRTGFGIVMAPPGTYPIQTAVADLLLGQGMTRPSLPPAPDEWIRRFGTLPLMHQPGEKWMYHTGSDVLGVLIARASGQPFDAFLQDRIFTPLGMKDTAFSVPASKLDRLATAYSTHLETGALELYDTAESGHWSRPPAFPPSVG
jgi:CubicO group peptidase (beta-lactamase class C family)